MVVMVSSAQAPPGIAGSGTRRDWRGRRSGHAQGPCRRSPLAHQKRSAHGRSQRGTSTGLGWMRRRRTRRATASRPGTFTWLWDDSAPFLPFPSPSRAPALPPPVAPSRNSPPRPLLAGGARPNKEAKTQPLWHKPRAPRQVRTGAPAFTVCLICEVQQL